jgi:sugar transferase EpsL
MTSWYRRRGKRCLDLTLTILLLLFLSPLILLTALLVRWQLGTPVLFCQQRAGYRGAPFVLYKFRSMREQRDQQGNLLSDAARLTRLGRVLRAFSLDELPQLWNVLRGDISLVGPRPLLVQYLGRYSQYQARRHEVKPGITGWAQVRGRNALTWEEKFELDLWYVDHLSLWLDVQILTLTVWRMVSPSGISAGGYATMPEFMGSDPGGNHQHVP